MAVWNEPDLASRSQQLLSTSKTRLHPTSTPLSAESLQRTYQDLFSFPFPNKVVSDLGSCPSTQSPTSLPSGNISPTQTFVLLVQALHNNAVRCWTDVRNGSLAHLLYPMLTSKDSPYNWCICIAKSQPKLALQSLDALFRLLFISAGKAVENNPNRDGHCSAFLLRMLGMRYHAAFKHLSGTNDGSIWDRIMRCGVEYERSTREGRTQADIIVLITAYKEIFDFVQELSPIDYSCSHYQSWYSYMAHFASKVDDVATLAFVRSIDPGIQDSHMIDTTPFPLSKSPTPPAHLSSQLITPVRTNSASLHTLPSIANHATISPPPLSGHVSVDRVFNHLEEAVQALRKFQDFLPVWQNDSLPVKDLEQSLSVTRTSLLSLQCALSAFPTKRLTTATLQNIARIFRSMDTLRKIGAKTLERKEKVESSGGLKRTHDSPLGTTIAAELTHRQMHLLGSIQTILPFLSDLTEVLWNAAHSCYQEWYEGDRRTRPDPLKLSCARVDAILFLSRLYLLNVAVAVGQPLPKPMTTYLESALRTAESMNDRESLPWISNALYNYGGFLFKTNQQKDAVRPLELAIHAYRLFVGDELLKCGGPAESTPLARGMMETSGKTDSIVESRLVLANRYDVLGVCFQSLHQVDQALECFNRGLCILPLEAFRQIDHVALGDMRTSHLPAAKLLNRRARTLLMMTQPCFVSALKSIPELQARLMQDGQEPYLAGAVQEYEVGLLSVLGVKANQTRLRSLEQIEILKHLVTKVYPGGNRLTHPVRRARVLVRLAMLYQGQADEALHGEALHLVEEAIEILKEWDLKGDGCLEPVRNHHLAMAYTWQGVLERNWDENGSHHKSKPFLIALQLWEVILSGVECFASWEKSDVLAGTGRQSRIEKVRKQIPDPEQLYGHLQMLADCFWMIDYRVLQVQIYRLMLRLCNGILPMSKEACADSVRIYSRMSQAYLALGYSGKAKTTLDHGKAILEEMLKHSDGHIMQCEVYPLWLLAHSLYLTSVGHKSQGVAAYNEAQHYSQMYMNQASSKFASASRHAPSVGVISRSVEIKVQKAMMMVEASLARSRLLFLEDHLPESIADAMRALRQLNRIISTLATAIEASQQDSTVICQRPMDNPFLIREEPTDRDTPATKATAESCQRRQGIDLLATQRNQWSIFRLLGEVYHQLSRLYLVQGSVQETEYFVKEGQHIARLSRAPRSLGRFMLDQAHVGLLKHEWEESQQILHDLAMDDDDLDTAVGSLEIQDARVQLLHGDLYFATERFDRSLRAYYRTDEILTHLMDKSVIMDLEQLVIREPQTPREKRLVTLYQRRGTSRHLSQKSPGVDSARGSPGIEKLECASLSEIKATMGYRTSLIFNRMGQRTQARELVEKSREEDPTALTSAEYHLTMAKMLMLELEDAMAKHLMYAMIPESALAIGLFQKTRARELVPSSTSLTQADPSESSTFSPLDSHPAYPSSSPSVRVTRISRRRRSQLALQQPLVQNPLGPTLGITGLLQGGKLNSTRQYVDILVEARTHLIGAFQSSLHTCPSHVVADICSRLTYLAILESSLHVDTLKSDFMMETMPSGERSNRQSDVWRMAARAACSLEMAKAVTQRREMHGLIKQKLHPTHPQEDQVWPKDIASKDHQYALLHEPGESQLRLGPELQRHQHKIVTFVGLEKPRPLRLFPAPDTDSHIGASRGDDIEAREDEMMGCDRHQVRLGKQAQLNHELLLHPSSTLGNDRSFLKELDRIYDQDAKMMSGTADNSLAFQRDLVDILPQSWTVVSLTMDVDRGVLYVNRLRANTMPLVVCLPLNRAQLRDGDGDAGLDMSFVEGVDGEQDTGRAEPLSYAGAFEELQDIMKESQETLSIASTAISGYIPATKVPGVTSSIFPSNRQPVELTKEAKTEWWSRRQNLNDRLRFLLSTMEDQWLCGLKGLIQSHNTPASEENLLDFKRTLERIMSQASNTMPATPARNSRSVDRGHIDLEGASVVQTEISVDLCRVILNLGDQPTKSELRDLIYFLLDACLFKNVAATAPMDAPSIDSPWSTTSPFIEYSEEQFGRVATQIREALRCYWEAEVAANNNGYDEGAHVILVLDKHLQMFPWESCPVLRDEAVSRVPSIWFLRDRILQQRHLLSQSQPQDGYMPTNKTAEESTTLVEHNWKDLEVDGQKTFYLLNPGKDLKNTEEEFKDYVKAQPGWNGIIGRTPLDMECIQGLSKNDLYIYFGHSGGEQYIKPTQIRKLGHCAVSILLGCSSGLLRGSGEFDPTGNAMNYMLAGCPTVVANLWDVTDRDLDRFSKALFTLWGLDDSSGKGNEGALTGASRHFVRSSTSSTEGSHVDSDYSSVMDARTRHSLQRPRLSIVEAVKEAREECRLKYLVGAATVVYGIPCFLKTRS
ncbi:MAG: peptidase family C50-domain-containing protein [Linnemannia elongata]|nr:MAG: peptidase family C50-domain-containing protein [Linnemannia elongata]